MPLAPNPQQLPYQVSKDLVTGANSRATQQALMSMPRFVTIVFESSYSEPMVLAAEQEPESIELTRIIGITQSGAPVTCGSMVHFEWRPELGGAQVLSIDGLTPDPAITYRFTFRITYRAQI